MNPGRGPAVAVGALLAVAVIGAGGWYWSRDRSLTGRPSTTPNPPLRPSGASVAAIDSPEGELGAGERSDPAAGPGIANEPARGGSAGAAPRQRGADPPAATASESVLARSSQDEEEQLRRQVVELKEQGRWGEAVRLLDEFSQRGALSPTLSRLLTECRLLLADAQRQHTEFTGRAEQALGRGEIAEALRQYKLARSYNPEAGANAALEGAFRRMVRAPTVRIVGGEASLGTDGHREGVPTFWIETTEVTNEQYWVFCELTGRPLTGELAGGQIPPDRLRHPVVYVSARDAEAFAEWIGRRLPTASEWEKAARWIDGRAFPWGNEASDDRANCYEYALVREGGQFWDSMAVGSFPNGASPYGVLDMAGNVWEWTSTELSAGDGPPRRILKGGSYVTRKDALRAASFLIDEPDMTHPDTGFRCASDRPPEEE